MNCSGIREKLVKIKTLRDELASKLPEAQNERPWVLTLQVLPAGRIVSGSTDGTIKIWDGEEVKKGI